MGLFSWFWRRQDIEHAVESVLDSKLRETVTALRSVDELVAQKRDLQESLDAIKRERAALASAIERERLDVQHKLGLESMRQAQEAEIAAKELAAQRKLMEEEKRVAINQARLEAKLEATKEAQDQMRDFQNRQEKMIENLMDALPRATHFHRTGGPDVAIG